MPKKATTKRKRSVYSPQQCLEWRLRALALLAAPPTASYVRRVERRGSPVVSFALPLDLCEPQDKRRQAPEWVHASIRQKLYEIMRDQMLLQGVRGSKDGLTGRPQVVAVRFSCVRPDRWADWGKQAIDILQRPATRKDKNGVPTPLKRLGLIYSDSDERTDVECWWEPARQGEGFVYIEVRV